MIKIQFILLGLAGFLGTSFLQAQTITLDFPHFAGRSYVFCLYAGSEKDTILTGELDDKGKTQLVIPQKYKGYVGMSQWELQGGGGLDLVINNENFSVSSSEATPNSENIKYVNSPENEFLNTYYLRLQKLLMRIERLQNNLDLYPTKESFHPVLEKELKKQVVLFDQVQKEIAESNLYAAKYRQMHNFLLSIPDKVYHTEEEKFNSLANFANTKLDIDALYTSFFWSQALPSWMEAQVMVVKNDSALLQNTQQILGRIRSNTVYTAFAKKMINLYSFYGKDILLPQLSTTIKQSGRLEGETNFWERIGNGQVGAVARPLKGLEKPFTGQATLLVFYESGCNACDTEMQQLKKRYTSLQQNYRIISISADMHQASFENSVTNLAWEDKLCDLEGFTGCNFINYGVIGAPTFILIDQNGLITGRYAQLKDVQ